MAYHIYHTEGIVLQTKSVGDANVILFVYTKDMGLIIARATSLRLHKSRLRFALQRFSHAHVDLVRGKHGWLLTSARTIDTNSSIFRHPFRKTVFAVMTAVLLRLIQGEDANAELYEDVCLLINELKKIETREDCFHFELLSSIRILNYLGYWDATETDGLLIKKDLEVTMALEEIQSQKKIIIPRINEAFKSTSL